MIFDHLFLDNINKDSTNTTPSCAKTVLYIGVAFAAIGIVAGLAIPSSRNFLHQFFTQPISVKQAIVYLETPLTVVSTIAIAAVLIYKQYQKDKADSDPFNNLTIERREDDDFDSSDNKATSSKPTVWSATKKCFTPQMRKVIGIGALVFGRTHARWLSFIPI